MAPVPTGVIRKFAIVEMPLIESEVPTILLKVAIPVTFKEVTEAIPPITFVAIPALSA